jgi:hypothetical protein
LIGGEYTLEGGFWAGVPPSYRVLLPFVAR